MAGRRELTIAIKGDPSSAARAFQGVGRQAGKMGGLIASAGKIAGAAFLGIGAVAVASGIGLYKLGKSFDAQFDKIRTGTGATGKDLQGLRKSFDRVLTTTARANFEDAGTAISDINTRLGLTGKPLERLSGQFINLSQITKTDLAGNIDNLTRVFGDWGVEVGQQAGTLDKFYRASQASGIKLDDLSTSVVQFGAPLRNLGFDLDSSLALLSQFNKTGVNTQTVFAGLKIGVGKLAKEGEPVPETFRRIVQQIRDLGPGTEATGLAIELFGQRAGPDLADAIAGGKFEIDDLMTAITDGQDTINGASKDTESFSEKWNLFKNRILVGLRPLAIKVFDGIGKAMDKVGPYATKVSEWFGTALPLAFGATKKAFEVVSDFVKRHWPTVKRIAQDVFGAVVDAVRGVVEFVKDKWPAVQEGFQTVFQWVIDHKDLVIGALAGIGALAVGIFTAWAVSATAAALATAAAAAPFILAGAALAAIGAGAVWAYQNLDWFRTAVDGVARWFRDDFVPSMQTAAKITREVWDHAWKVVAGVIETARGVIETFVGWFNAFWDRWGGHVKAVVKATWDFVFAVVDGAIKAVRGVIQVVTSLIRGDWSGVWNGIKQIFSGVWEAMKATVKLAITYIETTIDGAWTAVNLAWRAVWAGIKTFWDSIWTSIKSVIRLGIDYIVDLVTGLPGRVTSAVSGAFHGIVDALRGAVNTAIDIWNSLRFPGFTIGGWDPPGPGKFPSFTVPSIGVPHVSHVHSGGLVDAQGIVSFSGLRSDEVAAILQQGEMVINRDQQGAIGQAMRFPDSITLIIEGTPFRAILADHDRRQVEQLKAGIR